MPCCSPGTTLSHWYPVHQLVIIEAIDNIALVDAIDTVCVKYTAELSRRRKLHTRTPSTVRPRMHADTHMEVAHTNRQTTRAESA